MVTIKTAPDTRQKLSLLSADSQYDLACACGTNESDRRRRGEDGKWLYPVTLPNGGRCVLFKTLMSNVCSSDCRYCPLRAGAEVKRCSLTPEETVSTFMAYLKRREVFGLFLSSGVVGDADSTMDRLIAAARLLRVREKFRGYIHLKIIPGASDAAIEEAVSLSSAVSLNIETAGEEHFKTLSSVKDYKASIIRPLQLISRITGRGARYSGVKCTTQFVVGASDEKDSEIVRYTGGLYGRLHLARVYFSAYQRGLGDSGLPGECSSAAPRDVLTREHRLYQADWLLRKYGFRADEIPFDNDGNLSLDIDPKEHWARLHPERFPVSLRKSSRYELLRVPGIGETSVCRIMEVRKAGGALPPLERLLGGARAEKARPYVVV